MDTLKKALIELENKLTEFQILPGTGDKQKADVDTVRKKVDRLVHHSKRDAKKILEEFLSLIQPTKSIANQHKKTVTETVALMCNLLSDSQTGENNSLDPLREVLKLFLTVLLEYRKQNQQSGYSLKMLRYLIDTTNSLKLLGLDDQSGSIIIRNLKLASEVNHPVMQDSCMYYAVLVASLAYQSHNGILTKERRDAPYLETVSGAKTGTS